jgi:uncharacterized membrane protein YccC
MNNILNETRDWVRKFMKRRVTGRWACRSPVDVSRIIVRPDRSRCVRQIDRLMRQRIANKFRDRILDEATQQSPKNPHLSFFSTSRSRSPSFRHIFGDKRKGP